MTFENAKVAKIGKGVEYIFKMNRQPCIDLALRQTGTAVLQRYFGAAGSRCSTEASHRLGLAIVSLCRGTGVPLRRTQAPPGPFEIF